MFPVAGRITSKTPWRLDILRRCRHSAPVGRRNANATSATHKTCLPPPAPGGGCAAAGGGVTAGAVAGGRLKRSPLPACAPCASAACATFLAMPAASAAARGGMRGCGVPPSAGLPCASAFRGRVSPFRAAAAPYLRPSSVLLHLHVFWRSWLVGALPRPVPVSAFSYQKTATTRTGVPAARTRRFSALCACIWRRCVAFWTLSRVFCYVSSLCDIATQRDMEWREDRRPARGTSPLPSSSRATGRTAACALAA